MRSGWWWLCKKIMPLCALSCKIRLARFSARLKFQDRAECGNIDFCNFVTISSCCLTTTNLLTIRNVLLKYFYCYIVNRNGNSEPKGLETNENIIVTEARGTPDTFPTYKSTFLDNTSNHKKTTF